MRIDLRALCATVLLTSSGCGEAPKAPPPKLDRAEAKAEVKAPAEGLAERYLAAKERMAALLPTDKEGPRRILGELGPGLREVAEKAPEVPLRANASLLLGTLHEMSGDRRTAVSFYRQAIALLPEEVEARRVLALALAADAKYAEAIPEQEIVIRDDPDDLEAWLLLGELNVKAGRTEDATKAYAAYEMRRKGLIDGLTLQNKDGTWVMPAEQRAACARALIPARENGTAVALLYALDREPDPVVRLALAEAMGTQRLPAYTQMLTAKSAAEAHPEAKAAMLWALQEIARDPLDARPGPAPVEPGAAVAPGAEGSAPGTGPQGQAVAPGAEGRAPGTGPQGQVVDGKRATEGPGAAAPAGATPTAG